MQYPTGNDLYVPQFIEPSSEGALPVEDRRTEPSAGRQFWVEYQQDGKLVREGWYTREEAFAFWQHFLETPGHVNPTICKDMPTRYYQWAWVEGEGDMGITMTGATSVELSSDADAPLIVGGNLS